MSISKCIVRLKDCHNTEHSVEVYAQSLYEAVLRGSSRLQDVGWEPHPAQTSSSLRSTRVFCGFSLCALTVRNGHHSALANRVLDVAPANAIRTKTREPDHKMNGVPQRYKPNLPA